MLGLSLTAAPSVKVSPVSVVFNYQEGAATLPPTQTIAITPVTGSTPVAVVISAPSSPWLIVSPLSGRTALAVKVAVNPTSLPVGQYAETIIVTTPDTGGDPVLLPVTLNVKAQPADLRVSPSTIAVTYRIGDPPPAAVSTYLTTIGSLLSFSTAVTGTAWLKVNPASGAVFPGFRTGVSCMIDVADLAPGTYRGSFNVVTPDAVTKTTAVTINLTVQPGVPTATSLWPPRTTSGSPDTTVTINGSRFFPGTVVRSGSTVLRSTVLGPNALTIVIPSTMLASVGWLPINVSNPDPGGGAAQSLSFQVIAPGPMPLTFVNAASQKPTSLAPGEIITIYGAGLGPETLTSYDPASPTIPTTLGGTRVLIDGQPVPIIYTSSRQVSVAAPNALVAGRAFMMQVEYEGELSDPLLGTTIAAAPALFTTAGTGSGQAAAFQVDAVTGALTLNSDKAAALKGSVLVLYATGLGPPTPLPLDGVVATAPSQTSIPNVSVYLGDLPMDIQYVGASPGLITGIAQINAVIPDLAPSGKTVPITIRVGSISSPAGVTVNIK